MPRPPRLALALAALAGCSSDVSIDFFASTADAFDRPEACVRRALPDGGQGPTPFAVGTRVSVVIGASGLGGLHLDTDEKIPGPSTGVLPKDVKVTETRPEIWKVASRPRETEAVLAALAPGEGGIHVTASNAKPGDLSFLAIAPRSFALRLPAGQPGQAPGERVVIGAGGQQVLTAVPLSAEGEALCTSLEPGSLAGEGGVQVTPASGTARDRASVNAKVLLQAPAEPGEGLLKLAFGGASATVPVDVVDGAAVTALTAEVVGQPGELVPHVWAHPLAGAGEVLQLPVLIENLDPEICDLSVEGTSQPADGGVYRGFALCAARFSDGGFASGVAHFRVSVPGSAVAPALTSFAFTR